MSDMERFRRAVVEWAAGGVGAPAAGESARELAAGVGLRTVVLVEGGSDQAAVEALAARRGRDLDREGVSVVPLGGATSVGRFVDLCGPQGLGVRLAGLCDVGEERFFRRALERAGLGSDIPPEGLEPLGFYVCDVDLEDELIRSLGVEVVQQVVVDQGNHGRSAPSGTSPPSGSEPWSSSCGGSWARTVVARPSTRAGWSRVWIWSGRLGRWSGCSPMSDAHARQAHARQALAHV